MDRCAYSTDVPWPSLCNPAKEVGFIPPGPRSGCHYLSDPQDVFKFTLYWTLVFHLPFNVFAGIYAFVNFLFPPPKKAGAGETLVLASSPPERHSSHSRTHSYSHWLPQSPSPSRPRSRSASQSQPQPQPPDAWPMGLHRINARRTRGAFSLLVLLAFLVSGVMSAVVGAAVLAWVTVGVYRAGGFCVSTWVPFVWAVIQWLIALLEIWPSIIDII